MSELQMRRFWDARARENALYFVDSRLSYRHPEAGRFWDEGEELVTGLSEQMGFPLDPSHAVLDLGCGVGRLTRALAHHVDRVLALDISEEMLDHARRLNPALSNVDWVLGDGTSLAGIEDSSLDGCLSLVVFQHIPDPGTTLGYVREIGRVLRPGGWAAVQLSNDPSVHRGGRNPLGRRLGALVGRAPRGQDHSAWLGSSVELDALGAAAADAGLEVLDSWGEGTLFYRVTLRRRS